MADVFISYKAEEYNEANWVKTTLETNGITCWMAPSSIPGGSSYAVEIPQAIRAARVFVLILSEQSQLSKWVPRELDQAINEGKTILPFMLENCPLKDDFNFYLSNVQRYAAYENKAVAVEKMIREIKAILGVSFEDPAPAPAEGAPEKEKNKAEKPKKEKKKADKPKKEKKKDKPKKEKKKDDKSKKPKKWLRWAIPVAAVLVTLIIIIAAVGKGGSNGNNGGTFGSHVNIAGESIKASETYVTLKEKTLSANDVVRLSQFSQLRDLEIVDCVLPGDISNLFTCTKSDLKIRNCGLTDEQLAAVDFGKVTLNYLTLDDNPKLTDLTALKPLSTSLRWLSFSGCSVTDASFLQGFSSLTKLNAAGNKLTSLRALANCQSLNELDVSNNALVDFQGLESCASLVTVNAQNNQIKSLSGLQTARNLKSLNVDNNALTNLTGLEACIYLNEIHAGGNQIKSLDGLKNTTLLSLVDLRGNQIKDIAVLAKSKDHLRSVYLSGNAIESLAPLSGAKALTILAADNNKVKSLDALSASPELVTLSAAHNDISDLSGLDNCKKLHDVDLSYNSISDTKHLHFDAQRSYHQLNLAHNEIVSFVLPSCQFGLLAVYGNQIKDWKNLYSVKATRLVLDYHSAIDFAAFGKASITNFILFDCPLDQQVMVDELLNVTFTTEKDYLKSLSEK